MTTKKIILATLASLFISSSALAVPFKYDYTVEGTVVGVATVNRDNWVCYVAIKSLDKYYSGKYHAMASLNQCQTARMAYTLGLDTKIWAKIAPGTESNEVVAIELHNAEVHWFN